VAVKVGKQMKRMELKVVGFFVGGRGDVKFSGQS